MSKSNNISFAPELYYQRGTTDISFYEKAFGAVELMRFDNDDGSIHVAEFSIDGAIFYVHEESLNPYTRSPQNLNSTTVTIGLFVPDVDAAMAKAIAAGAKEIQAAKDHDYGYRQGEIQDPFGHNWMIQKRI